MIRVWKIMSVIDANRVNDSISAAQLSAADV
jgi:hypothetical protein